MEKFDDQFLERDINCLLANKLKGSGLLILQEMRLHPCEMDIVLLDKATLQLAIIEIKRSNWRYLLRQALRTKLYSHYSIAAMPKSMQRSVPIDEFTRHGVGVAFFEVVEGQLEFDIANEPQISNNINRGLKQQIYRRFYDHYGEIVYA